LNPRFLEGGVWPLRLGSHCPAIGRPSRRSPETLHLRFAPLLCRLNHVGGNTDGSAPCILSSTACRSAAGAGGTSAASCQLADAESSPVSSPSCRTSVDVVYRRRSCCGVLDGNAPVHEKWHWRSTPGREEHCRGHLLHQQLAIARSQSPIYCGKDRGSDQVVVISPESLAE